ncbi:DUF421 domain-containing protein [Paracoccus sp. 1_MG-2023]|uniref:DUF421 domain-containing protein n=1 Tax=unclassified Paracoccus (in: a-proteobacteria) TaxID=2688777 RepID=UPI001C098CF2|nr:MULTISPECIES: YetF domain-containing protein [unclassified Paracoccus (in: a-proteobacteria)]MBU2956301.1 DUF421 domain-containing protein [Paracoccus sp. C2R09]MDO6667977.1 DUF421 domain-containing protein [Paracoccus sp. 1_MG-2023]
MDWSEMFFQGWSGIVRTILIGLLAYVMLVLFLRISGKRTLAKLNAFDLVVTVAIGSILASILLQKSIPLAEGATALGLLIGMQYAVASLSVRSRRFATFVRSEPTLLVRNGEFCDATMKSERITRDEALSAMRAQGCNELSQVKALILESDGSISAIL